MKNAAAALLIFTLVACGGSESGGDEGMMEEPGTMIEASGMMTDDSAGMMGVVRHDARHQHDGRHRKRHGPHALVLRIGSRAG
jgi:hypothetical protein